MAAAFVWYFFPGLMFVGLSYFTWICWIVPRNRTVNQVFGMQTGLGVSPITFDWTQVRFLLPNSLLLSSLADNKQIAYNTNPLLSPSWAAINVFAGFVMFFWSMLIPTKQDDLCTK